MDLQEIQTIVNYNYWADHKLLAASARVGAEQFVASTSHNHGSLRGTLVHVMDSESCWRKLCQQQTTDFSNVLTEDDAFGSFPEQAFPTVDALAQRWAKDEREMRAYVATLTDADLIRPIRYKTGDGDKREFLLWQCLYQMVNHDTQHRSKAAVILTDYGASPGELDFTMFLGENR